MPTIVKDSFICFICLSIVAKARLYLSYEAEGHVAVHPVFNMLG